MARLLTRAHALRQVPWTGRAYLSFSKAGEPTAWVPMGSIRLEHPPALVPDPDMHGKSRWLLADEWNDAVMPMAQAHSMTQATNRLELAGFIRPSAPPPLLLHALYCLSVKRMRVLKMKRHKRKKRKKMNRHRSAARKLRGG
eukprot:gb/GEZN01023537.1/.p1 GENE.gb/GEZN01023537.1/~~gb/GEZN01023537.1/.p1  ORF type:complete len:142 (+),score=11.50 gb/GEZN01023537.1/:82-507(+)